jgi:hypothetical protein
MDQKNVENSKALLVMAHDTLEALYNKAYIAGKNETLSERDREKLCKVLLQSREVLNRLRSVICE